MTENKIDFLFEVSWEVCNKVGGIHTVVSTKAYRVKQALKENYILIGPDIWREEEENPEFEEDKSLYENWKAFLEQTTGIKVRTGRWNVFGNPTVFLIDFSNVFNKKNEIFTHFWELYGLDSLYGSWDYIEPAMFGYAAGQVIESFVLYHFSARDNIVAQFHEWMTGTGILYLKEKLPHVATVFTTHATVTGRSIAGNRQPLYKELENYDGDLKAKEFNVISKHSLEKISAREADVFTTVSEITAKECQILLKRKPDIITPNGFEKYIVPEFNILEEKRQKARKKLRQIAESLLGYKLGDEVRFIATSGRYEFWNKGFDVFINAVAKLNEKDNFKKEVVAFILVAANNYGPRKDLLNRLNNPENFDKPLDKPFLTHGLHHEEYDLILNTIKAKGFTNAKDQKAKIIFIPTYLNGNDGIVNLPYYEVLSAMDLTIFPSYYEPWGYTPLESLAFYVPTITTTLAGFGLWIKSQNLDVNDCITVAERTDDNYDQLVELITDEIIYCAYKNYEEQQSARQTAHIVSNTALWKNLVQYYFKAYETAIERKNERAKGKEFPKIKIPQPVLKTRANKPIWRTITIEAELPEKLRGLDELAKNLWWTWNEEAEELFETISPELWKKSRKNPVKLLRDVSFNRLRDLSEDPLFFEKYSKVYQKFKNYINISPRKDIPSVAYFSMEFGLTSSLKIYSGGLGVLAGDYLKQASDTNVDFVAVGMLYKYGYFTQKLSLEGDQIVSLEEQNFSELPVQLVKTSDGDPLLISVAFPGRKVYIRIWQVNVGRVKLFLLDTDFELNEERDRQITHQLYGGDLENRLKQEFILGIGGVRALNTMGIDPDIYHMNEGHTAFLGLERIRIYMQKYKFTFNEALEIVKASNLFTTHTPVAAGHDTFPEQLIMTYFRHYPERLKISWEEFLKLGKVNPLDKNERFSMSFLAANLSQEINAVSKKHREVSTILFAPLWEGYFPCELHLGYVTNGIHLQTWMDKEWKKLFDKYFAVPIDRLLNDKTIWAKIYAIPDKDIWNVKNTLRKQLVAYIHERITDYWRSRRKDPKQIIAIKNKFRGDVLTFGFARRFATYKRGYLLFTDPERLSKILNNPEKPAQIVIAGKAHPADKAGQEIIKKIIEISKRPEFLGKIIFLEDYDMNLAKALVSGVDVWINTPTRPLEASGTSGMKASVNGVLNLSVLDGWWIEGYRPEAGWALPENKTYDDQFFQDQLDAQLLYDIIENEIAPMFYERNEDNVPEEWIKYIKNNFALIAPDFTTARMLDDYIQRFYLKLKDRKTELIANDFEKVQKLSAWKRRFLHTWDKIDVLDVSIPEIISKPLQPSDKYKAEVVLNLKDISPESIGLELIITDVEDKVKIVQKTEFKLVKIEKNKAYYRAEFSPQKPGTSKLAIRMFPKHYLLPHRMDFPLVKWL